MTNATEIRVEVKTIEDLIPDPKNVNKHTVRGHQLVENSIRRRGVGRGILAAGKGVDKPEIVAGNLTHEKARDAGIDEVIFVHTTGNQLVVTVRDDLEPGSAPAVALGIEDNESGKQSYNPDVDVLAAQAIGDSAVLAKLQNEDEVFGSILTGMGIGNVISSLDDLEKKYGGSDPDDFNPVIRVKVTPEIKERFEAAMAQMEGTNEMEKFDALISRCELS